MLPGICNGRQQCSTCHIILDEKGFQNSGYIDTKEQKLLNKASEVCLTSRLACQIRLTPSMKGAIITVPSTYINWMDDSTGTPVETSKLLCKG